MPSGSKAAMNGCSFRKGCQQRIGNTTPPIPTLLERGQAGMHHHPWGVWSLRRTTLHCWVVAGLAGYACNTIGTKAPPSLPAKRKPPPTLDRPIDAEQPKQGAANPQAMHSTASCVLKRAEGVHDRHGACQEEPCSCWPGAHSRGHNGFHQRTLEIAPTALELCRRGRMTTRRWTESPTRNCRQSTKPVSPTKEGPAQGPAALRPQATTKQATHTHRNKQQCRPKANAYAYKA